MYNTSCRTSFGQYDFWLVFSAEELVHWKARSCTWCKLQADRKTFPHQGLRSD